MTDDESRKAFFAAFPAREKWQGIPGIEDEHYQIWQASAKYHTERERERCAKIVEYTGAFWNLATDHEDWARIVLADICEKEPKP